MARRPGDGGRVNDLELPRAVSDRDGRAIQFSRRSWQHIQARRPELLAQIGLILAAIPLWIPRSS